MKELSKNIQGVLTLNDVIGGRRVIINSYLIDADVNARVIQHGSNEFEVTEIDIQSNIALFTKDGEFLKEINANSVAYSDLVDELRTAVELLVLDKARKTSEDLWDYQYLD